VVSAHGREQYGYDSAGNLTHAVWPSSASMPHTDAIGARSYAGTHVDRAGNIRYQHDGQGRIVLRQQRRLSTKDWIWRYEWDDSDRLVAVTTPDGSRWHYRYDPLGRRIAKQRLAPDGVDVVEQVDFTWDGTDMVEQAHNGNDTTTWDYADHQPLTQVERKATQDWFDQRFYAIATDLIGSPTELVDADGTVAWHHEATLWGAALDRVAGRAYTPLRFPGQYFDAETGLHYNHHRYYDPTTARYASQDPLGLLPAPNPVTYVPNPLSWTDRLGLMNCNIHVSSAFQDWGTKGAHVHIDGAEVRVYPDGQGGIGVEGIRLRNGNVPTPKQLAQVQNAIETDPGLRADLIQKTRSVMDNMNAGTYGMAQNRAAEMNFLIKALEKMG
jgi:RHS repeat-associated protein